MNIPETIVVEELFMFIQRVRQNIASADQVVSHATINSIKMGGHGPSGGNVVGASYIGVLETGRKPGKFPPLMQLPSGRKVSVLYPWVMKREAGSMDESACASAAYLIARSIAQKGTALWRKGGRKDIFTNEVLITERIVQERLNAYYEGILVSQFKDKTQNFK